MDAKNSHVHEGFRISMGKNARYDLPWSDAPFVLSLARNGSFAGAAREMGVDRTTVSRRLDALESRLGARLFDRTSIGLELTEEGRRIVSCMERAEQELRSLNSGKDDPRIGHGKVRVSISPHVISAFAEDVRRFAVENPKLLLEFLTTDYFVNLHRYEADIAIRIGTDLPHDLYNIVLGEIHFGYYRSVKDSGEGNMFWGAPGQTDTADYQSDSGRESFLLASVDGVLPMRDLIANCGGIGVLPTFLGATDKRLAWSGAYRSPKQFHMTISCLPEQKNLNRIRSTMRRLTALFSERLAPTQEVGRGKAKIK